MRARRVRIELGERSYEIRIAPGALDAAGPATRKVLGPAVRNAIIVSNPTVWALYGDRLTSSLEGAGFRTTRHLIGDGERFKKLSEVERAVGTAVEARLERGEPIIALGGGVVGDLAGLVAALYMRGTPLVAIPTTLLAQIDSSIGGKVAVNHPAGKNLVGAFHQPVAVFADPLVLATLPAPELRSGLYEAIKYGVLGDAQLFGWIERRLESLLACDEGALAELAARCCRIKADIVAADEREGDLRRVLNLGHTAGHALETATRYRRYRHGEAVGYGLEVAAELAVALGALAPAEAARIRALVARVGDRPRASDVDVGRLLEAIQHDKKRTSGGIPFILPVSVGAVEIRSSIPETEVCRALQRALGAKTRGEL